MLCKQTPMLCKGGLNSPQFSFPASENVLVAVKTFIAAKIKAMTVLCVVASSEAPYIR